MNDREAASLAATPDDSTALRAVTWAGIMLLVLAAVANAVQAVWQGAAVTAGFAAASLWCLFVSRRLPGRFRLALVAAGLVAGVGWVLGLFDTVAIYDEVAHVVTGLAVTVTFGFVLFHPLRHQMVGARLPIAFIALFSIGLALGAVWEIAEWLLAGSLGDTESDLTADAIGAAVGALLASAEFRREVLAYRAARSRQTNPPPLPVQVAD